MAVRRPPAKRPSERGDRLRGAPFRGSAEPFRLALHSSRLSPLSSSASPQDRCPDFQSRSVNGAALRPLCAVSPAGSILLRDPASFDFFRRLQSAGRIDFVCRADGCRRLLRILAEPSVAVGGSDGFCLPCRRSSSASPDFGGAVDCSWQAERNLFAVPTVVVGFSGFRRSRRLPSSG